MLAGLAASPAVASAQTAAGPAGAPNQSMAAAGWALVALVALTAPALARAFTNARVVGRHNRKRYL